MSRKPLLLPDCLIDSFRRLGVDGTVVVAVSGGADSVALLRGTCALAETLRLTPVVAHFDHGVRVDSSEEARWVAALAHERGLRAVIERTETFANSNSTLRGGGFEERARRLRYAFLKRVAESIGASFVVTAHTADDLAETVLFHMLRGTGLRGLRGIPTRRRLTEQVTLVRPLLEVTRPEIERYLAVIEQPYLTDPSNADVSFMRNRLRHELLPLLRDTVNPRLDEALRRLSVQANEASRLLHRSARRELAEALLESSTHVIRLRTRRLKKRPRPVIREAIALAWRRAGWPRQAMGFAHWNALADLVLHGGRRTLPAGTDARRRQGELILRRA